MSRKQLRVGVAGYGRSGCDIHVAWLRHEPGKFKIVAVADQLPARRKDAERDFGCLTYEDYRQLLKNTEMDLFINALPSHLHGKVTVEALKKGHHVVCEKPNGRTVREFDRMVAAAKKAGKLYLPFQNSRFYPFFTKMKQVMDSGVLGDIVSVRSIWGGFARRWDWQTLQKFSGGNLLNTGPHPMDHAVVLFGEKDPKVFCRMKAIQPFGGDAEDFCIVTLYGDRTDPVIEVVLNNYLAYPAGELYTVCGTLGGLTGGPNGLRWKFFGPKKAPKQRLSKPWSDDRKYCSEALPWKEKSWVPPKFKKAKSADYAYNSYAFYKNVYDVLVNGAEPVIKHAEVRRQIKAIEACHRQNPLPKRKK